MIRLLRGYDGRVRHQREVNPGVGDQVGLEFSQIDVQGAVESQRSCDGGHNLANQSIQVRVSGPLDVQITTADVVNGFIVNHKCAVGMFKGGVRGENGIVRFNDSCGDLRGRVDGEFQFRFLAVIDGQTFHQQRGEPGTSTATERVEDQETLKTSTLVCQLANSIQYEINNFLSDRIVTTGIVICCVFLAGDQLFWVE